MTFKWKSVREDIDAPRPDRPARFRSVAWLPVVAGLTAAGLFLPPILDSPRDPPVPIATEPSGREDVNFSDKPTADSGEIESGESFYDLMKRYGTPDAEILSMNEAAREIFDLRRMKAGRAYRVFFEGNGAPAEFGYEIDDHRQLVLSGSSEGWTARIDPIEYEIHERVVRGIIEDSLYLSLVDACQSTVLAVDLSDIFAWDIDFALDLRKGDAYGILYQERWREDHFVGPGRILAAQIVNQGETYNAVYYDADSGGEGYYDEDGQSLEKQFLKSPLRFKYISSYFSQNRLHPILKIHRPHLGVDYAAPYGTPVRAAADGRVSFMGRNGGMGNMIKIRHNHIYSTVYGHLSRYAASVEVGQTVRQGEIIGYVGSTGLSTGPHLHYSFYKYGRSVNPMREQNPRARSVPLSEMAAFEEQAHERLDRLRPSEYEKRTAAVAPPGI